MYTNNQIKDIQVDKMTTALGKTAHLCMDLCNDMYCRTIYVFTDYSKFRAADIHGRKKDSVPRSHLPHIPNQKHL
jgi:hypothetical protein